jgi:hypothetical protein
MKDRSLKISSGIRENKATCLNEVKTYPRLILQGDWMAEAGFNIGDKVSLKVSNGRIEILKDGGAEL